MMEIVDCVGMSVISQHFGGEICENILIVELLEFSCEGKEICC